MGSKEATEYLTWLTMPGVIIDEDNTSTTKALSDFVQRNNYVVSFMPDDVFTFESLGPRGIIIVFNRLKPTWAFLDVTGEEFRKEFFGE